MSFRTDEHKITPEYAFTSHLSATYLLFQGLEPSVRAFYSSSQQACFSLHVGVDRQNKTECKNARQPSALHTGTVFWWKGMSIIIWCDVESGNEITSCNKIDKPLRGITVFKIFIWEGISLDIYTVGNLVLRRRASGVVKRDFRPYISPN